MSYTICSLNLNGIRSAERRGFGKWLDKHQPHVLCVQELRATPDQVEPAIWSPAGYNSRWLCAQKKGYAGVGVYTRAHTDRYTLGSGIEWADCEGRCLRADIGDVTVYSLYLPSGTSGEERQKRKYEYLAHALPWMRELLREKRKVALCGDFNIAHTEIDIHDPRGNAKNSGFLPEERAWLTQVLELGWVDVVRKLHPAERGLYSWWSNRGQARANDKGWRIDYVLASPELAACAEEAWIEKKADLSDHAPVWVRFSGSLG